MAAIDIKTSENTDFTHLVELKIARCMRALGIIEELNTLIYPYVQKSSQQPYDDSSVLVKNKIKPRTGINNIDSLLSELTKEIYSIDYSDIQNILSP